MRLINSRNAPVQFGFCVLFCIAVATTGCRSRDSDPVITDSVTASPTNTPATSPFEPTPFPAHADGYGLVEAAEKGLIEYQVNGTNGSSGDALLLSIRRTSDQPITIYIDMGTVFGPSDSRYQRMVATRVRGIVLDTASKGFLPVQIIQLDDLEPRLYVVEAYCMDFNLDNPSPAVAMTPLAIDARSAVILSHAQSSELSIPATQAALWIDRDHISKEKIQAKFTASDQDIEDAWQLLKGLPPP